MIIDQLSNQPVHGTARLGHTGAHGLATRGCAPPVQVRNQIIGTGSIIVECKSGTMLIIHEFAVTYNVPRYRLRTNMGGCKIQNLSGGVAPRPP